MLQYVNLSEEVEFSCIIFYLTELIPCYDYYLQVFHLNLVGVEFPVYVAVSSSEESKML